jgi:hypothetical protein
MYQVPLKLPTKMLLSNLKLPAIFLESYKKYGISIGPAFTFYNHTQYKITLQKTKWNFAGYQPAIAIV